MADCRNEVSEELRVSASGSTVTVNSEYPRSLPLLKPGRGVRPRLAKAFLK